MFYVYVLYHLELILHAGLIFLTAITKSHLNKQAKILFRNRRTIIIQLSRYFFVCKIQTVAVTLVVIFSLVTVVF